MAERSIMPALGLLDDFATAACAASNLSELSRLTSEAARELGFERFAMVHHVRFGVAAPGVVCLTNYPVDFLAVCRDAGRPPDPILRAAERTACGFAWERVEGIVRLSPREERHRGVAARHGLVCGYTVPSHVPGEPPASVSLGAAPGRRLDARILPAADAFGRFAFEAARQLTRAGDAMSLPAYRLSERQRDCVSLIARGKSDAAIAERLGLRPRTVNEHVEAAKRRYGVGTRAQLVAQVLLRGDLAFADLDDPAALLAGVA